MKRQIAIVCGGDSSEHDVSMRSGSGLYGFFDKERYDVYVVEMRGSEWWVHINNEKTPLNFADFSFDYNGKTIKFDYAYITVHGTPGENGILQGYLELMKVPYSTSGVLVEALTFDKFVCNQYLRSFGVSVADSILVRKEDVANLNAEDVEKRLGLPVFVKPVADGSSFGVTKVKTLEEMLPAIGVAMEQCSTVMIEGFLEGTEITCGCYKTKAKTVVFPITEVVTSNEFFDYNAKYNGQVQEITPARISADIADRVSRITSMIYDILHCNGIIRVDYIISPDGKINMLEVNTTPGMTATSFIPQQVRAAGLNIKDVLTDIVENQF
ncbi:MAG: D-alanine--D-alanine ligase [Bacteroidaceae bacterium]|nr:D-alanine--D-alanine ligase [Bacteroidaceae bacterium]